MTGPRTFTVDTKDRGILTVTDPEWCTVDHHQFDGAPDRRTPRQALRHAWLVATGRRPRKIDRRPHTSEIAHTSEPIEITINTQDGPIVLGGVQLWQDPYPAPSFPNGAEVYVSAFLGDDSVDYPIGPLDDLAAAFIEAAGSIRLAARDLAALAEGGDR